MNDLPALARQTPPASPMPTLDQGPYRWLALEPPGAYSKLPAVAEEMALRRELVAANEPVALDDLRNVVKRLVGAYPQKGPADLRPYILAVVEHLAGYPHDVVAETCRRIVRASRWLPAVAELIEVADDLVQRRRNALRSLDMVPVERERRRLAEEQEREHREARARWEAAGERARERLNAALTTVDPARRMDAAWHRLSAHKQIVLKCAAQQGDDALDAAIAELTADPAVVVDDGSIPF